MNDEELNKLKLLLVNGKDCRKLDMYKKYYQLITGKNYGNKCSGCACTYIYNYLKAYLNTK